ncbi:MAG: ABC transporter permease [Candidatus Aminicenantes bacterium]|nr:ABC transporter permease [Candidatus Aminicenantes bacterium]
MACCILILIWINDEIRFDRFHKKADNLYRVVNDLNYSSLSQISSGCAFPLGPAMKEEIPEIKDFTRFLSAQKLLVAFNGKRYYEDNFYFADPSVFRLFSFPIIKGNPDTARSRQRIHRQPDIIFNP